MIKNIFFAVILIAGICLCLNVNAQDKGSKTIQLEKGKMPAVTLDHHMHQEKLNNACNSCHDLFPMQAGVIKEMIAQDKLKKQQVMNKKCLKCHKDRKKQGLAAGPTSCKQCHVRTN